MAALSLVNRDYAATLVTAEKIDCPCPKIAFSDLLARGKSPKVSVLEAESSRRRHDSTSFLKKVIFSKFEHTTPPEPRYLNAVELKDPRPAPPDNGAIEEKRRPPGHNISGHDKNSWRPL
jgi:hypothetical protein